ncbi:MAG: methylenetetrahydrofolate reductase C-terminal domain-containing protein [Geminicoccaceae bacterium]|nr:methylenetetrahydrofolate reductase C-terminal domain-containing protein [Geminicoccaceae bacterium]
MYDIRLWSVRHARLFEGFYRLFERSYVAMAPLIRRIGVERVEKPVAAVERIVKGTLFDCRMCGRCVLSSTGMSCPMNCPKQMRNGPCGGVRANGHCEVRPQMRCVWVQAYEGSRRMSGGHAILDVQKPVDRSIEGSSSWIRVMQEKAPASTRTPVAETHGT